MTEESEDDIAAVRAEVEQTREELGETVEALASKADVKSRAQEKADEVRARAGDTVERVRSKAEPAAVEARDRARELPPPVLAGAAALVLVALVVMRRRRSRRTY